MPNVISVLVALALLGPSPADSSKWSEAPRARTSRLDFLRRELSDALAVPLDERRRLPPRMLVMRGCSGSTFVLRTLKDILRRADISALPTVYELLHEEKNPYFHRAIGMHGAMTIIHARAVRRNMSLVFKAEPSLLLASRSTCTVRTLVDLGTRAVQAWRHNVLDYVVSENVVLLCAQHAAPCP